MEAILLKPWRDAQGKVAPGARIPIVPAPPALSPSGLAPSGLAPSPTAPFDPDLVRRYDGNGPRYTSYPTADRFTDAYGEDDYRAALAKLGGEGSSPVSLYVHLPFCESICYYCACNKVITRDKARATTYVGYVAREIEAVAGALAGRARASQLHWGGGTPTFLSVADMAALDDTLRGAFDFAADAECSIEIDPRRADATTIAALARLGFNRMSVGIQDFDPAVQQAVNRIQGEAETRAVIDAARAHGFGSVSVDLIYGLPRQTVAGFARTLARVATLRPDRIALYSYAHVPHLFKSQRGIDAATLPGAQEKLDILALAVERLAAEGYVYIGMDHFALPDDSLAKALRDGTLHRNFQGYSTQAETALLAFGVSAIGSLGESYVQNERDLDAYYARLDAGDLPVMRGVALTGDDHVRRAAIQALMCDGAIDTADFGARHGLEFSRYFAEDLAALAPLADDGLVRIGERRLDVTPRGRQVVRAVAMAFDKRLRDARAAAKYSKLI